MNTSTLPSNFIKYSGLVTIAGAVALLGYVSCARLIAFDEGFYLYAAKLVSEGYTPYTDFFYSQTFLSPYIYAAWGSLFGMTWISARIFTWLMTAGIIILVYRQAVRAGGSTLCGAIAILLFGASGLVIGFFTTVKTYTLPAFLLFFSYVLFVSEWSSERKSPLLRQASFFLSGALLGLSADVRMYFIAAAPVFYLWGWKNLDGRRWLLPFSTGLALALGLNLPFFLNDPEVFLFSNYFYHSGRVQWTAAASLLQKIYMLRDLTALAPVERVSGSQFMFLSVLVVWLWYRVKPHGSLSLSLWISLILAIVMVLPTPAHSQYYVVVMPFVCLNAAVAVFELLKRSRRITAIGLWAAIALYVLAAPQEVYRYTLSGEGVAGINLKVAPSVNYTIDAVNEVAQAIDRVGTTFGSGPVAVFFPGYLIESARRAYPGMENSHGVTFLGRLTQEQANRYKMITNEKLAEIFRNQGPATVALGIGTFSGYAVTVDEGLQRMLIESGYCLVEKSGFVDIYAICTPAGSGT